MKRFVAGPLWFLAFWFMYEVLWSVTGVPRMVGPVIALVVAATVWVDPLHWFWPVRDSHSIPVVRQSSTLRAVTK